jgi:NAD(P)-dependent dehydrogenase (short-subunit alcohol dehydrogenase family)
MEDRRHVIVTGGSRGIGEAIARRFLSDGARVSLLDVIDPSPELAHEVDFTFADISDPVSVAAAFSNVEELDVLVNNAGIQRVGLVGEQSIDEWRAVINTNLTGAFLCTAAALPLLRRNGGAVVSVASAASLVGVPGRAAYTAAKAGLLGFTRVLAVEVAAQGIRANVVAPGFTATGLVNQALADGSLQEDWMLERVPMARLARPSEIAAVVAFLAGPDAAFITGQQIVIDGGWTVQGIGHAPGWLMAGVQPIPEGEGRG